MIEMVRANPGELVRHAWRNTGAFLTTAVSMTNVGQFMLRFTGLTGQGGRGGSLDHRYVAVGLGAILAALFSAMAWRLWSDPNRRELAVFAVGFAVAGVVAGLLTNGSAVRILHVVYGVFMIVGAYWAERSVAWLNAPGRGPTVVAGSGRAQALAAALAAGTVLFVFTQGGWARADARTGWAGVAWSIAAPATPGSGTLFYAGKNDPLFKVLDTIWPRCRGLMTVEMPQFVGAFSRFPPARLYSPFEIPPFGRLGQSDYAGLRRDRVNCVYAPHHVMKPGPGAITNIKLRYDSYIGPYMQSLLADGAEKVVLPSGVLVILN